MNLRTIGFGFILGMPVLKFILTYFHYSIPFGFYITLYILGALALMVEAYRRKKLGYLGLLFFVFLLSLLALSVIQYYIDFY